MRDHRMGNPRHTKAGGHTNSWITPPFVIEALGGWESFDLDPCACTPQPVKTARHCYTIEDDGLRKEWFGRDFVNPPYSKEPFTAFLRKLAEHGCGVALIFAKTETEAFHRYVWSQASGLLFIKSRLHFYLPDGSMAPHNSGAPSVLVAYGTDDLELLSTRPIEGQFIPLRFQQMFLLDLFKSSRTSTWREAVESALRSRKGPVKLCELYEMLSEYKPENKHWREKVRQTLRRGRHVNVGPGLWKAA